MRSLTIRVAVCLALLAPQSAPAADPFTTETVRWSTGDVSLVATLYLPKGDGPFPSAVFLHGSGSLPRGDRLFREHGERLARMGVALLVYDKRGVGDSTGDWKQADFKALADDAVGGIKLLRAHAKTAGTRLGLLGVSQGGWVAAEILARDAPVDFVVMLSAPPTTPDEQAYWITKNLLESKGFDAEQTAAAVDLQRRIHAVYRTGEGWDAAAAAVEAAKKEPWFEAASTAGVGLQARDSWNWKWYASFMDYDPRATLARARVPIFAVYGEKDSIVPAAASAEAMRTLATNEGRDVTVLVIPGAPHDLGLRKGSAPATYWTRLEAWLRDKKVLA